MRRPSWDENRCSVEAFIVGGWYFPGLWIVRGAAGIFRDCGSYEGRLVIG